VTLPAEDCGPSGEGFSWPLFAVPVSLTDFDSFVCVGLVRVSDDPVDFSLPHRDCFTAPPLPPSDDAFVSADVSSDNDDLAASVGVGG